MKILYHNKSIFGAGGLERILIDKARRLASMGHDVAIVVTDTAPDGRKPYYDIPDSVRIIPLGIEYGCGEGKPFLRRAADFFINYFSHRQALRRLLEKERPDILISAYPTVSSFIPSLKDGSRKILEFHFSRYFRIHAGRKGMIGICDRIRTLLDKRIAARFDRFVVLTRQDQRLWGGMENITVITNGLTFDPGKSTPSESKKVIAAGRLVPQKGFDNLLRVWQLVKKDPASEGWILEICGEGALRRNLTELAEELGLSESVSMPGNCHDIESRIRQSAILVSTSRYEGLGMFLMEGMAAGIPAAAFACECGPEDLITHGENGFLVKPDDIRTLADCILQLMRNPCLRDSMGNNARNSILLNHNADRIMQKWEDMFHRLIR